MLIFLFKAIIKIAIFRMSYREDKDVLNMSDDEFYEKFLNTS
jgi:hypothetical protein